MAHRLGRVVTHLSIADDGSGVCRTDPPQYPRTAEYARRAQREDLMITLAGAISERRADPVTDWWAL
jgi:hypothetical protein